MFLAILVNGSKIPLLSEISTQNVAAMSTFDLLRIHSISSLIKCLWKVRYTVSLATSSVETPLAHGQTVVLVSCGRIRTVMSDINSADVIHVFVVACLSSIQGYNCKA